MPRVSVADPDAHKLLRVTPSAWRHDELSCLVLDGLRKRRATRKPLERDISAEADQTGRAEVAGCAGDVCRRQRVYTRKVRGVPQTEGGDNRREIVIMLAMDVSAE